MKGMMMIVDHQIMSIKSYLEMRKQASKKSPVGIAIKRRRSDQAVTKQHVEHGTAVRCKVFPKPAPNANFCCAKCSDELEGKIFGVCGPKSGRMCYLIHQKKMWTA